MEIINYKFAKVKICQIRTGFEFVENISDSQMLTESILKNVKLYDYVGQHFRLKQIFQ